MGEVTDVMEVMGGERGHVMITGCLLDGWMGSRVEVVDLGMVRRDAY